MKQVEGLSEEKVMAILTKISSSVANKFIFSGNSREDIIQQGILEGILAINNGCYKPEKHLRDNQENTPAISLARFMSIHIPNRLNNYRRNNNKWAKNNQPVMSLDINLTDGVDVDYGELLTQYDIVNNIKRSLAKRPNILNDFHRLMDGAPLPFQRKKKLKEILRDLLVENGYEPEEE